MPFGGGGSGFCVFRGTRAFNCLLHRLHEVVGVEMWDAMLQSGKTCALKEPTT